MFFTLSNTSLYWHVAWNIVYGMTIPFSHQCSLQTGAMVRLFHSKCKVLLNLSLMSCPTLPCIENWHVACYFVGGDNAIQPQYMLRLTCAMDELFQTKYKVPAQLVTDVYLAQYAKKTGNIFTLMFSFLKYLVWLLNYVVTWGQV